MAAAPDYGYTLSGAIEPTRITFAYRLGLAIVALAMLILPVLYVGMIVLAAVGVVWHLGANTWILSAKSGGIWRVVVYLAPAVAGIGAVFFMIKPVLARPERPRAPVPVDLTDEPGLRQFIHEICSQVRAPLPARVVVDCQINASASFARHPLWPGHQPLVLTIGLPLAAGLTMRQFAGVLAHEFGHFAQGGGMRLTYVVRSINAWFSRVVYERDEWDVKLQRWSEEGSGYTTVPALFARFTVWCSRQILALLMRAGHMISCFLLRQMEYDADSYEVKLVGSRTFAETMSDLDVLNASAQVGWGEMHAAWRRRQLPSDLPTFLLDARSRLTRRDDGDPGDDQVTRWFDTHPSTPDRLRAAERLAQPGLLSGGKESARMLFKTFDRLSLDATRHHYEFAMGLDLDSVALVGTSDALISAEKRRENQHAARSILGNCVSVFRPIRVDWAPGRAMSRPQPTQMESSAGSSAPLGELFDKFDDLERRRIGIAAALELLECGFSAIEPEPFGLSDKHAKDAEAVEARIATELANLEPQLAACEAELSQRLAYGLCGFEVRLASVDEVSRGHHVEEAARLVAALNVLADAWPHLTELFRLATIVDHVLPNAARSPMPEQARARLGLLGQNTAATIVRIKRSVGQAPGPDPGDSTTLASLLGLSTDTNQTVPTLVLDRAAVLRTDVVGRVSAIVLEAETGLSEAAHASC